MSDRAAALAALRAKRAEKEASKPSSRVASSASSSRDPTPASVSGSSRSHSRHAPEPNILVPNSSPLTKREFKPSTSFDEGVSIPRSRAGAASSSTAYREPPQKRQNTGQSSRYFDSSSSSSSRVVPQKLSSNGKVTDLTSSDEASAVESNAGSDTDSSLPDDMIRGKLPKKKLTKGPRPKPSPSTSNPSFAVDTIDPLDEDAISRFANFFPTLSRKTVVKQLEEHEYDTDQATESLCSIADNRYNPKHTTAPSFPLDSPVYAQPTTTMPRTTKGTSRTTSSSHTFAPAPALNVPPGKKVSAIYANRKSLGGGGGGAYGEGSTQQPLPRKVAKKEIVKMDSDSDDEEDFADEGGRGKRGIQKWSRDEDQEEKDALAWFNTCTHQQLLDVTSCNAEQAKSIISVRPFEDVEDLRLKFTKKRGISPRLFDNYIEIMQGYHKVDAVLKGCEAVGNQLARAMSAFTGKKGKGKATAETANDGAKNEEVKEEEGALNLVDADIGDVDEEIRNEKDPERKSALKGYIREQPPSLVEGVKLKDYQMLGLNWLNLLWKKKLSCILADEMGLGKTIQVIAFICHLVEIAAPGPHLVIVPASTLENWAREFQKFAGDNVRVQTYYGPQAERREHAEDMLAADEGEIDVVITTYQIATGSSKDDKRFLKKMAFETAIFDEGHQLKNYKSARYQNLMNLPCKFRLLLTGTPLQNNLQELVSILNFILPDYFEDAEEALRAIFKVGADSHANLLSQQRVSRAQKMMKPFVLRRRKDQVLKDLPKKTLRIEWCSMTPGQQAIYDLSVANTRQTLSTLEAEAEAKKNATKGKKRPRDDLSYNYGPVEPKKAGDSGSNVLMSLRKAACHPLLFRSRYDDGMLKTLAKDVMKDPVHASKRMGDIIEDMEVMSDAELHVMCTEYPSTTKHVLPDEAFMDSGKVKALQSILKECEATGERILVFSMFTQTLDILKRVLDILGVKWVILTGITKVDERQGLVDEFTNDPSIKVFLLSTLAGGMGINLTAANKVVIYDQGYNPHNEKQAADRAYRIGQTRDVEVITLLSTDTIDEDINNLALSKLRLDDAVAGRPAVTEESADAAVEGKEGEGEKKAKSSLLQALKVKLDAKVEGGGASQSQVTVSVKEEKGELKQEGEDGDALKEEEGAKAEKGPVQGEKGAATVAVKAESNGREKRKVVKKVDKMIVDLDDDSD